MNIGKIISISELNVKVFLDDNVKIDIKDVLKCEVDGKEYRFDSMANGGRFLGRGNKYLTDVIAKNHFAYSIDGERFTVKYADK